MRKFGAGSVWLPGKIVESTGPVSFHVLEDGHDRRCHQDQLRPRVVEDGPPEMSEMSVDADGEAPPITTIPVSGSAEEEISNPEQGPEQPASAESAPTNTVEISDRYERPSISSSSTQDSRSVRTWKDLNYCRTV